MEYSHTKSNFSGYKSPSKQDQEMREERLSVGEGFLECLLPLEFTGQLCLEIQ